MSGIQERQVAYRDRRFLLLFVPAVNVLNYYLTYSKVELSLYVALPAVRSLPKEDP